MKCVFSCLCYTLREEFYKNSEYIRKDLYRNSIASSKPAKLLKMTLFKELF